MLQIKKRSPPFNFSNNREEYRGESSPKIISPSLHFTWTSVTLPPEASGMKRIHSTGFSNVHVPLNLL